MSRHGISGARSSSSSSGGVSGGGGNAGEVVVGLEQVLLDDDTHPFVANIRLSEFKMHFFSIHETKYTQPVLRDHRTITFSSIVTIQHIENTLKNYRKDDIKTLKFELTDSHFTRLFLRRTSDTKEVVIDSVDLITCGFSRLHAQIMSLWHAQRLRASLCIDDKFCHSDAELAEAYYTETLASLREAELLKSPLAEQIEILHEFSEEVVSDIELKMICFQSKELFVILFNLYQTVLHPPDHKMIHMKNKALVMTHMSSKQKADLELEEIIFKRLLLFHAIVKVMHAILVSTQSIESRFEVFTWSAPLTLRSWVEVCVNDVHEELCRALNYTYCGMSDTLVNMEIDKSFEDVSISTPKRKKRHGTGENPFFVTNKITNVFTDQMLTPLRHRVQKQFALYGVDHRSKMAVLVRSIKDLQVMLAHSCVDACVTGRQAYQVNGDVIYPPPSLRIVEILVRNEGWEEFVENIMIRIANILDDMLQLDSVVKVIKKRFHVPGRSPGGSARHVLHSRSNSNNFTSCPPPDITPPLRNRKSLLVDTNVYSPRLAAIPSLDRIRMSPSPRHKGRKKLARKASFKELTDDGGDRINTIFETQEHLLHNACMLIRSLVLDNSKIRNFLVHEIDNHWFGIMHSLNLLFPRPEEPEDPVVLDDTSNGLGALRASFSKLFSKKSNVEKGDESIVEVARGKENLNKKNKDESVSKSLELGKGVMVAKAKDTADEDSEEDDEEANIVTRLKRPKKQRTVMLHEYGPPLYEHLSPASWDVCILARMAIENSIELLDLDIKFYHEKASDADNDEGGLSTSRPDIRKTASGSENDVASEPSRLRSRLSADKPPLQKATEVASSNSASSSNGISMIQTTPSGSRYDVTVPVLSLPKHVNDSFEKRLLNKKASRSRGESSSFGSDAPPNEYGKSDRIAARFKRK